MNDLFSSNTPARFWQPLESIEAAIWEAACARAASQLPETLQNMSGDATQALAHALAESIFGPHRYELSRLKRIYYGGMRAVLPNWVRPLIRKVRQPAVDRDLVLDWPVEDRLVRYLQGVLHDVMRQTGRVSLDFVGFWPDGKRFGFVLTHDVEARPGHDFVRKMMGLEEKYGFRSSFNFVPEGYAVDEDLLVELRMRGFEIGVHGLNHDGRLFLSQDTFMARAPRINDYISQWQAAGYRSPMTHRQPEWLQALDIEYDLSFFDTDPYEPMAGGTMSIWPYFIGHFVELPYTLMQDHTYLNVFGHKTPQNWLDKVEFIRRNHGMVLLNAHPDYLMSDATWDIYEAFLAQMSQYKDMWHGLPRDLARWWRWRADQPAQHIPGQRIGTAYRWRAQETGTMSATALETVVLEPLMATVPDDTFP